VLSISHPVVIFNFEQVAALMIVKCCFGKLILQLKYLSVESFWFQYTKLKLK